MALFTAATAAEMGRRSAAARAAQAQRIAAEPPQPVAPPALPLPAPLPTEPADTFTIRKLARIREQIDQVEKLLDDASEPQAVDRFANALTRLYDLERILAGRPLPGSRRPQAESKRGSNSPGPTSGPWLPAAEVTVEPAAHSNNMLTLPSAPASPPAPPAPAKPMGWEYDTPPSLPQGGDGCALPP